jgi:hypothetical protein
MHPNLDENRKRGVYTKYNITKADGSPVDPGADYFVLRLDQNPGGDAKHVEACRVAILAYAEAVKDHLPVLAAEIVDRFAPKPVPRVVPEGWVEEEVRKMRLAADLRVPFEKFTGMTIGQTLQHRKGPPFLARLRKQVRENQTKSPRPELLPLIAALEGLELPDVA